MPLAKSASVVILNKLTGKILLCPWKRDPTGVQLSMPGGKGGAGETHMEIALRELAEETGIRLEPSELFPVVHAVYDGRNYKGYVCLRDITLATFRPAPGETTPGWYDIAVLKDKTRCPYADINEKLWVFMRE